VVFVPSLNVGRFPSKKTGKEDRWLIPRGKFPAERYEGSEADECRLFYVAMTRARDWLVVSRHERITKNRCAPSPYYEELACLEVDPKDVHPPAIEVRGGAEDEPISIAYSDLSSFIDCGHAYRLRSMIGFQPRLAVEIGYGNAVHHVMQAVAEETRATGQVPTAEWIDAALDENFYLPTANKTAYQQLRKAARRLVMTYVTKHPDDLRRVWEAERPFELHLDGVTVTGRADVILGEEDGVPGALALIDYKTSASGNMDDYELQLQVYADAGQREGLDVRGAYIHDLKTSSRKSVAVDQKSIERAESTVIKAAVRIRARNYEPNPGPRCRTCEVRTICSSARS